MNTPVKLLMDEDTKVKVMTPFSSKLFSHYFNSAHFPKLLWGGGWQPKTFKCKGSLKGNTLCFNGTDKRSETDKIREAEGKKIRTLQKVKTVKQV